MSSIERFRRLNSKKRTKLKQSIRVDRWDMQTASQIRREVKDFVVAENDLGNAVETGIEAMNDALFALYKAKPEVVPNSEMRSSHAVNRAVIDELMKMPDFEKNRYVSVGDPIGTGLACASMEPDLEILFDKLSKAQDLANQSQIIEDSYDQLLQSGEDLIDQIQNSETEDQAKNYQQDLDRINDALDQLNQQLDKTQEDLQKELESQSGNISQSLKSAVDKLSDANQAASAVDGWGFAPGGLKKMSPDERIKLSKKLQTERFKRMAEIFGKMQSVAFHEQTHKVDYAPEEVYDLEQGADLQRVVPIDMLSLTDDILVFDWLHRFVERNLTQYALRGEDSVVKGGIILLEDGSSSMSGTREIWAKAIGLALLKVAALQHRPFSVINFSGPNSFVRWNFDTTGDVIKSVKFHNGAEHSFEGISSILDYAETTMSGGTNFETPLSIALDILNDQFDRQNSVDGDIVFLTDGECGVAPTFLEMFKANQAKLGFQVFGVAIQTNPSSEPFNTICDGRTIGLKQLTDVNDMRPLFSEI